MATQLVARRDSAWIVISISPDVCLTPMGGIPVPVPYQVTASLSEGQATATTVNVKGNPAFIHGQSIVPTTKGGEAGTQGGVMSGTTGQKTWPKQHSGTVRVQGQYMVRAGDLMWMNGAG